ncbi:hypothetical protein BC937DRAFT_92162, partial [Endogone sp. FLAS-F59071]
MDTSNMNPVPANGPVYNAPILNIGPNPIYGNVNNHPPASVPVVEVKDAPEVDEHWRHPILKPLAYELIAMREQLGAVPGQLGAVHEQLGAVRKQLGAMNEQVGAFGAMCEQVGA